MSKSSESEMSEYTGRSFCTCYTSETHGLEKLSSSHKIELLLVDVDCVMNNSLQSSSSKENTFIVISEQKDLNISPQTA